MTNTSTDTANASLVPEDLESFEQHVEEFLSARLPVKEGRSEFVWGQGEDDGVKLWEEPDSEEERARLAEAREWRRERFEAGLGWLDGPIEFGGEGLSPEYYRAYRRIERQYQTPNDSYFKLDRVLSPVLLERASDEVKTMLPRALHRGDAVACELFSEPGAGSDLFSVQTQAVKVEDGWKLTGQKVWTSDAHLADIGIVMARTATGTGKNDFTSFVLDMDQPGVTVVPLRQMTGGAAFNEVFLDDAFVPDAYVLGEVGEGWDVTREILARERAVIGAGMVQGGSGIANGTRLTALVHAMNKKDDPVIRQELVKAVSSFWAAKQLTKYGSDRSSPNGYKADPTPYVSKLALSNNLRSAVRVVTETLGPRLIADSGEWGTFSWNSLVLGEPGVHIFAGTNEIMRNSLAEKVLSFPRSF